MFKHEANHFQIKPKKTITIFSKKGGSGKSTIAKEMANIYSNVSLPKRFSNKKENV